MCARTRAHKRRALWGGFVGSRSVTPRFTTEYSSCCAIELPGGHYTFLLPDITDIAAVTPEPGKRHVSHAVASRSGGNKLTVEGVDPPARQRAPRLRQLSDTPLSAGLVLETGSHSRTACCVWLRAATKFPRGWHGTISTGCVMARCSRIRNSKGECYANHVPCRAG